MSDKLQMPFVQEKAIGIIHDQAGCLHILWQGSTPWWTCSKVVLPWHYQAALHVHHCPFPDIQTTQSWAQPDWGHPVMSLCMVTLCPGTERSLSCDSTSARA